VKSPYEAYISVLNPSRSGFKVNVYGVWRPSANPYEQGSRTVCTLFVANPYKAGFSLGFAVIDLAQKKAPENDERVRNKSEIKSGVLCGLPPEAARRPFDGPRGARSVADGV
jgi:hypothetical protein